MNAYRGLNAQNNTFSPANMDDYRERITYDPNGNIKKYERNGTTTGPMATTPALMDDLTYRYGTDDNRLARVEDAVLNTPYTGDIENQSSSNYEYDKIGNLTKDVAGNLNTITWTVYGKIESITKTNGDVISYRYDAAGNRICKTVGSKETWYVRDAQGNVMSVYEAVGSAAPVVAETHLYGSSRLGLCTGPTLVTGTTIKIYTQRRGQKRYELSNHLGNVLVTISDKKLPVANAANDAVAYFTADVATASDYAPFGMALVGRTYDNGSKYRYGFNRQEKSDDVTEGNYTAEYWEYDSRIGRRWNVDPKPNVGISEYSAFLNNPIWFSDPNGDNVDPKRTKGKNFIITPDKILRRRDRIEHSGEQGKIWDYRDIIDPSTAYYKVSGLKRLWAGVKGTLRSAYTGDFLKAKIMQITSFGKLNIVEASNAESAVNQMIKKLGSDSYVANLVIDYHSELFGEYPLDDKTNGQPDGKPGYTRYNFSQLAAGYIGAGSNVYLGQCWGGGNPNFCSITDQNQTKPDMTAMISEWLDGATTYGNRAAASSLHFLFTNSFIGVVREEYGKSSGNRSFVGQHSVSVWNSMTKKSTTEIITNNIRISNNGQIMVGE